MRRIGKFAKFRLPSHRHGFVLLMVLVLLTFAVVILARFSQQSLKLVAQANRREREIQNRWAAWSIASAALPRAERILRSSGDQDNGQVSLLTSNVELGGRRFHVYVNDLDAAVNLNSVVREGRNTALKRAVTFGNRQLREGRLNERVIQSGHGQRTVYDSWGQIFNLTSLEDQALGHGVVADLQQHITCWGSGQLNLARARDETIRQFGTAIGRNGLYSRVIRERNKSTRVDLDSIMTEAATAPEDAQLLRRTLRANSAAWSILVTSETGGPPLMLILESGFGNFADRRSTFSF